MDYRTKSVDELRRDKIARLKEEIAFLETHLEPPPTPLEQAVTLLEQVVDPPSPDWLLIDKIRDFLADAGTSALEGDE